MTPDPADRPPMRLTVPASSLSATSGGGRRLAVQLLPLLLMALAAAGLAVACRGDAPALVIPGAGGALVLLAFALWLQLRLLSEQERLLVVERAGREGEERFQQLAGNIREVFWLYDAVTQRVLYTSPAFAALWGYPVEHLYADGALWLHGVHADDRERVGNSFAAALTNGRAWQEEHRLVHVDGSERRIQVRGFPIFDAKGRMSRMAGISEDISERHRAETALRERERFIDRVTGSSPHIIYVFDVLEQRTVYSNRLAAADLGYDAGRTAEIGSNIALLLHPDDLAQMPALLLRWEHAEDGQVMETDYRLRHADGSWHWFVGRDLVFARDAQGKVRQILGTAQDVTARRKLEEQLQQAQKMDGIGRLAGGIAHDFNNLLTAILGHLELARRTLPTSSPALRHLDVVRVAAERSAGLTRQLLGFARRQMTEPRVIALGELLSEAQRLLRHTLGEHIEIAIAHTAGLPSIRVDPAQMMQVVMNLAVNARDAMPDGGRLTLAASSARLDTAYAREHREVTPGDYVLLTVTDTGSGIPDTVKPHLFEPFFTTKDPGKGTGLGLATCYGIVTQNRGHIAIESTVGNGTIVRIYLPPTAPEPLAAAPAPLTATGGHNETLLLIEDDEVLRALFSATLTEQGYMVLAAGDGQEALALAAAHAGTIHLLVTDVVMPRLGGPETAERLRAERPSLRVLFITGHTENAMVREAALNATLLQKPFTPLTLAAKVRTMLDGKGDVAV